MKLLRMKPGHGEILLAEGDVEVHEQEQRLIEAFRASSTRECGRPCPASAPMGAAAPSSSSSFSDVPRDAERVIFFPRAAGGALRTAR